MKKNVFFILLVLVLMLVGCNDASVDSSEAGKSSNSSGDTWKIGALYPLSGNLAVLGNEALAGAEVAIDIINEQGGVEGKTIEIIKSDVTDPQTATTEARRLITQNNVDLLIGTYGSSIMLANAAVANQNKVIYWEGGAVADDLTKQGYKYVFRSNDNTTAMANAMVDGLDDLVAKKKGKSMSELKVALVNEDSSFGMAIADLVNKRAEELGVTIVFEEEYSANSTDLSSLILKLKSVEHDALLVSQYYNDAILFWKQSRENDYNPEYIIASGTGQTTPDFFNGVGTDANGILVADVASTINQSSLTEEAISMLDDFEKRYQEKVGKEPASHATRNFISMYILFNKVIPQAGGFNSDDIRNAALSLDEPLGSTPLGFGIKFGEDGQNERVFNTIQQWQDNKLVTVWPEEFATAVPVLLPLPNWKDR